MDLDDRFKICRMQKGDIRQVKAIETESNLAKWPEKDYSLEIERDDSICLIGTDHHGSLRGFLIARIIDGLPESEAATNGTDQKLAEIYNIAVERNFREKGLGKLLVDELFRLVSAVGGRAVWLEVRKSNREAIGFYETMGFAEMFERIGFYSGPTENAIVMKRSI